MLCTLTLYSCTEDTPCSNSNVNVNNSSYLQVVHWSTGQWTDDCITRRHVDRVNVIFHNELHSVSLCNVSGPGLVVAECGAPPNVYESLLLSLPRCWCRPLAGLGTSLTTQVWSPTAAPPPPTTITTSKPSKLGTRLILPKHLDIFHILSISESKNCNA